MHTVNAPILGFEEYKNIKVTVFDEFFSTLTFNEEDHIALTVVNAKYLSSISLDLEEDVFERMHIEETTQYDIYFIMVLQAPIENSIVNLAAPLIINHDAKSVGQFIPKNHKYLNTCMIKEMGRV